MSDPIIIWDKPLGQIRIGYTQELITHDTAEEELSVIYEFKHKCPECNKLLVTQMRVSMEKLLVMMQEKGVLKL